MYINFYLPFTNTSVHPRFAHLFNFLCCVLFVFLLFLHCPFCVAPFVFSNVSPENTKGATQNGQCRDTDNFSHKKQNEDKQNKKITQQRVTKVSNNFVLPLLCSLTFHPHVAHLFNSLCCVCFLFCLSSFCFLSLDLSVSLDCSFCVEQHGGETLEKTKGATQNGQCSDTDNSSHKKQNEDKQNKKITQQRVTKVSNMGENLDRRSSC
jgi:hypothetical protein